MYLPETFIADMEEKVLNERIHYSDELSNEWKKSLLIEMIKKLSYDDLEKFSPVSIDKFEYALDEEIEKLRSIHLYNNFDTGFPNYTDKIMEELKLYRWIKRIYK